MSAWKPSLGLAAAKIVLAAARLSSARTRHLTLPEQALLAGIYGPSLALELITLRERITGLLNISRRAFVIENTIFLPVRYLPLRRDVLVHEACHVWQFQNGGHAYIADSLHAQFLGDGYRLEKGLREGRRWHELNCEQQATLVEEAWAMGCFDGRPFILRGRDYTPAFHAAIDAIRAGAGASFGARAA